MSGSALSWGSMRFKKRRKKKSIRKSNETKQSVKSCLKSHAKYWMPQACILPGTEVYRTLELEQHSSPTQNTNIQIYDLFFLQYLQCVADKGKIDDSSFER